MSALTERMRAEVRAARDPATGLSSSHISTPGRIEVSRGGQLARLRIPSGQHPARDPFGKAPVFTGEGPGVILPSVHAGDPEMRGPAGYEYKRHYRGKISGFSGMSRRRLLDKMAAIDRRAIQVMPYFLTMTYHDEWPDDMDGLKRHLDAFSHALARMFGKAPCVWKLEYQQRGAPHFHLLWFGTIAAGDMWALRLWLSIQWASIATPGDKVALRVGCRAEQVESWNGAMYYCAKYLGKDCKHTGSVGRYWGVWYWGLMPHDLAVYWLTRAECYKVRRAMVRFRRRRGGRKWRYLEHHGTSVYLIWYEAIRLIEWVQDGPLPEDDSGP